MACFCNKGDFPGIILCRPFRAWVWAGDIIQRGRWSRLIHDYLSGNRSQSVLLATKGQDMQG